MARPKKAISADQVVKLAKLGASVEEIANFFCVDRSTIHRRFATQLDKGRSMLKLKLRRLQIRTAEKGSALMLLWLGKNLLGQSDRGGNGETPHIEVIIGSTEEEEARLASLAGDQPMPLLTREAPQIDVE